MSDAPILVMAGGTGGHVFPALALATELIRRGKKVEWLGTSRGIESTLVPAAGINLNLIEVRGVRGKALIDKLKAPLQIILAVFSAIKLVSRLKPSLVIGFGGFASGPGGVAARVLGKPLIVHEQNAVAGTTNRLLAKTTPHRITAFPNVLVGGRCLGNPVREEIRSLASPWVRYQARTNQLNLLVIGGSLGATFINKTVPAVLAGLHSDESIFVRHQCGPEWKAETEDSYKSAKLPAAASVEILPFIDDMASAYSWADLVVCRAGAMTVSELAAAGVASILIPLPSAIDDHQTHNAEWLSDNRAAWLVPQSSHTKDKITQILLQVVAEREQLLEMAERARQQSYPDALSDLAELCEEVANER